MGLCGSRFSTSFAGWLAMLVVAVAVENGRAADGVNPIELVSNLENPCGVVVHNETGHVFIASRHGVYRYPPQTPELIHIEILNEVHPTDVFGSGPQYEIGPLGLAFLDNEHLVVGDGSRKDGDEFVRVFKINPAAEVEPHDPLMPDAAVYTLGPIPAGDKSAQGEGDFYGVAVGAGAIFVTSNGDDSKGWVAKSVLTDAGPSAMELFIATKVATGFDAPGPITLSPDDSELVVGQIGELDAAEPDSVLSYYDPQSGELKRSLTLGIADIAALAFSPKTGKLYCTDFSWAAPERGGLYELTVDGETATATKLATFDKPTGLSFDKDGNLFLVAFGTAVEGSDKSPGSLFVIDAAQLQ